MMYNIGYHWMRELATGDFLIAYYGVDEKFHSEGRRLNMLHYVAVKHIKEPTNG